INKTCRQQKHAYEYCLKIMYKVFNKKSKTLKTEDNNSNSLYNAAAYVCRREHIEIAEFSKINESCKKNITIPNIARISHFICRRVVLEENWYKRDCSSLVVFDRETRAPYACVSKSASKYYIYDPEKRERSILTKERAEAIASEGYMFYRPFENKALNVGDLIKFGTGSIKPTDFVYMLVFVIIGGLAGLLIPILSRFVLDSCIPFENTGAIVQAGCMAIAFITGNIMFSAAGERARFRILSKIKYSARGAACSRLFGLKESFFRGFDSTDLARRAVNISYFISEIFNIIFKAAEAVILALIYFVFMMRYSPMLSRMAFIMLIIYNAITVCLSLASMKYSEKDTELNSRAGSILFQFIRGISKIRIAGVEDRALYEYLKPYTEIRKNSMKASWLKGIKSAFKFIGGCIIFLILYYMAVNKGMNTETGAFIAFSVAFGLFYSVFAQLSKCIDSVIKLKPCFAGIKPILEAVPEYSRGMELPGDLNGEIEISNLTFAYSKDEEPVLKNLSLHIKEGEYVGIAGPSGCGKSTLIKLLLGFETPQNGKIYYDKKDIDSFDKRELRKKLGVVLQGGKLIFGSIYENITVTAPDMSKERLFEIIRRAGLEEDIRNMPMGLHTLVSEDSGTISGGQQQRILIARAMASKPKILIFDEATSAVDNVTQARICESIAKLKATRIVVAHRLSTVMNCDRIIVLDKGGIAEAGTYRELMDKKGLFYNMADRQTV
ncbi:MAG: NHLP bacteriocin export ABC transporter permease/ATPase subunit, partial [Eubacterium sp.]|nr:NHLP bacteriocin export ABC transporter permease/ATPase subunit [Eubacterium sp.]